MDIHQLYNCFKQSNGVTTDTRRVEKGCMFFALKGDTFNGNAFAKQALEQGCAYAVIDDEAFYDKDEKRMILVDNTLKTLQQLAHHHRLQLGTPIIGITGTNGKTTTKELIATVLSKRFNILYTEGNLNNQIGVPLTLLRLNAEHEMAIVEMGANHLGDIKELVDIVEPNYGIITNVGMAHLQGFGSLEGVIRTKGELYDYLRTQPDAVIFLHNDNEYLKKIAKGLTAVRYGSPSTSEMITITGERIACDPYLRFHWRTGQKAWNEVTTHLIGSYNMDNALCAATVGHYMGMNEHEITEALESYEPHNNRSQLLPTQHNQLIVDAYNANPTSMRAALINFEQMKAPHKMAILGDMKELGEATAEEHQKIVNLIAEEHFDEVWLVGDAFAAAQHSYRTFPNVEAVKEEIARQQPQGYHILIKGSNSTKLYTLTDLL